LAENVSGHIADVGFAALRRLELRSRRAEVTVSDRKEGRNVSASSLARQITVCETMIAKLRAEGRLERDPIVAAWRAVLADLRTLKKLADDRIGPGDERP
jgi:hypothetical protein